MNKIIEQYIAQKEVPTGSEYITRTKQQAERYADEHEDEIDKVIDSEIGEFLDSLTEEELNHAIKGLGLFWEIIIPLFAKLYDVYENHDSLSIPLPTGEGYCPLSAREAYDFIMAPPRDLSILKEFEVLSLISAAEAEDYPMFEMEYNKLDPSVIAKPLAEWEDQWNLYQLPNELFINNELEIKDVCAIINHSSNKLLKHLTDTEKTSPIVHCVNELLIKSTQYKRTLKTHKELLQLVECKKCLQVLIQEYERIKEDLSKAETESVEVILSNEEYKDIIAEVHTNTLVSTLDEDDNILNLPDNFFNEESIVQPGYIDILPEEKQKPSILSGLINWLAQMQFIDRDLLTRRSLAFILSGCGYQEELKDTIIWKKEPEIILGLCKFLYKPKEGNVKSHTYSRAKMFFNCGQQQESFKNMYSAHADLNRTSNGRKLETKLRELFP